MVGMARPLLVLVVAPVYLIGSLISRALGTGWESSPFWWGFLVLLPATIASHYANEYADIETDAITRRTPFSGGSGLLGKDKRLHRLALIATWLFLAIGAVLAGTGFLTKNLNGGAVALWLLGTFTAVAYSLPPFKLAWRGWSEVINAVLIGILLPLYGYTVQSGLVDWRIIVGCAPFALLMFVLILATNWSDRDADRQVGKFTLSARLPQNQLRLLYSLAAFLGIALQPALIGNFLPVEVVVSSLPAVPLLVWAGMKYTRIHSPLPTVIVMLVLLPLQLGAWIVAGSN